MKKIVSVLLTLSLLFGLVIALPSAPARAESTAEQELTEAFANLNTLDSLRMDLDFALDLAIVMSMEGQTIVNLPMSIALNMDIEIQKTPYAMRGQMEMHMTSMGQKENKKALMYGEADGDAVISYSSEDDGATWTKKRSEKASFSLGDLSTIIGSAKEIQKINMETVDGHDMDVYTAIVDGQYLQQALDAAGSDNPLSEMMGENGTDGMGDFEVVIYVDRATNLPVRLSIDLASMMKDLLSAAVESSMGMSGVEGMEMKIDISVGTVVCELSQFNSIPFIEIPAAVKAAGTDTGFGLTPVATPSTSTLPPAEIKTDYDLPPIGADLSTLPPAEIKTDYDLPPIGADLSTLPPAEIKTDYGLTPVATPSVTELENATISGVSMPPMGTSGEEDQTVWSVIGTIDGSNWDKDFPMVEVKSGVWVSATLPINAGDEYKFRANKDWTVNIGREGQDGSNFKTEFTGPCLITLDFNNKTVTCAERNEDVWAVIGNFSGTAWDTDFPMAEVEPGVWRSMPLEMKAYDEFKVRLNGDWSYGDFGADCVPQGYNILVAKDGKYIVTLDLNAMTLTYTDAAGVQPVAQPVAQDSWGVIGTIDGSYWDKDFPMVEVSPGVWVSDALQLKAGDEFKVRMNGSWVVNYGITQGVMIQDGANVVVDRDGTYVITLDLNAMTLTFMAN